MTQHEHKSRTSGQKSDKAGKRHEGKPVNQKHGPAEKDAGLKESSHDSGGPTARKLESISAELHEEVLRERDEYLDSLQRLQAEFANFRKRVLRDSEQQTQRAANQVIEELLPVLDNFERAMKAAAEHDEKLLTDGVEIVYNQLRDILGKRGLCEIDAHGAAFDPNQHEAVMCQSSRDHDEDIVMHVLEKGYQLDDKVLRPARVIVSTAKNEGDGKKSR